MKKTAVITLLLFELSGAREIGLSELVESAKAPKLLLQRVQERTLAVESKSLADIESAPFTLNHATSNVNSKTVSGYEYEFSLSKEFKLGNIQKLEKKQTQLSNEAYTIEAFKGVVSYENSLKNLYHQYCLEQDYLDAFESKYANFSSLYEKKSRAFREDEISKKELLQLELEKRTLEAELARLQTRKEDKREMLFSLTTIDSDNRLSCQDIYPIVSTIELNDTFSLTHRAYEKRIESTQVGLKRYSQKLESIELSTGYTKELDRDLYTIGISLPLNFTSNKSEYEKATLLHESSAISLQNEQELQEKSYRLEELKKQLKRLFNDINAKKENINHYQEMLLPLMKKSYNYGESSVIEYLLHEQKLYGLKEKLLEREKEYYHTLFELYSVSEIKESR